MSYRLYEAPFAVLWLAWLAYWIVAARDVKTTRRREGVATFLLNRVFVVIGALLLAVPRQPLHWLDERFVPPASAAYFLGLVMVAAGLGFAVWARVYLGRNWSATVTVKQDHELIRTRPLWPGAPSDLYRIAAGAARNRSRDRRVAGPRGVCVVHHWLPVSNSKPKNAS